MRSSSWLALHLGLIWIAMVQGEGEGSDPLCTLSNLDVLDCTPRASTSLPGTNEYAAYRTSISYDSDTDLYTCKYRDKAKKSDNEVIAPIVDLGSEDLRLVYSPGFLIEEDYLNNVLVKYNISCPAGKLAYVNITSLDLQAQCNGLCVDYVLLEYGDYGQVEVCGHNVSVYDDLSPLHEESFQMIFRSSHRNRYSGYQAYVICYEPDTGGSVKKREVPQYEPMRPQSLEEREPYTIHVHVGDTVTYTAATITVTRMKHFVTVDVVDNTTTVTTQELVVAKIGDIRVLCVADVDSRECYYEEASRYQNTSLELELIKFKGPGPIYISQGGAKFQLFAIDPTGVILTDAERAYLDKMIQSLLRVEKSPEVITRDVVKAAVRKSETSNPVLRSASSITLDVAQRKSYGVADFVSLIADIEQELQEEVDCGQLDNPSGGEVQVTGTKIGDVANYTCFQGYRLHGTQTRRCQKDGQWTREAPTCQLLNCGRLKSPVGGTVILTGTTVGSRAFYTCEENYELKGTGVRVCEDTELWSGEEPVCELQCSLLYPPVGGKVRVTGTTYGSQAFYSCTGALELRGSPVRICLVGGMWSGVEPTCELVDCGPLEAPAGGKVLVSSSPSGYLAVYSCEKGFELSGDSVRYCQSDGVWSGRQPTCEQLVDCGPLEAPAEGTVLVTSTTPGALAVYSCRKGYDLIGDSVRTCQSDGVWSGREPTCEKRLVICPSCNLVSTTQAFENGENTFVVTATVVNIAINRAGNLSYIVELMPEDGRISSFVPRQLATIDTTLPVPECPVCTILNTIAVNRDYTFGGYSERMPSGEIRWYLDVERNSLVSRWPSISDRKSP